MQYITIVLTGICSFLFLNFATAQKTYSISGIVKESNSGEILLGASVKILENPSAGAITNRYGFYSITLPTGPYTLVASFAGYRPDTLKIQLNKNSSLGFQLAASGAMLSDVKVQSSKNKEISKSIMGAQKLSVQEIEKVPVIFGEKDIMKTIQLLPGIKTVGEGSGGLYVRGGGADQNLVLLDEATIYNGSHLMGFFSAFNADAIKDLTLYKGAMPANYGGRLSSVVDVTMNDGNNQDFHAKGGIGLIASRLTLEGPLKKNKGSFIISGRRSYADLFLKLSNDPSIKDNILYFYDINAKANYALNDNNKIYLSGYFGRDKIGISGDFGFDYGNKMATARWNHIFSGKLFSNTSLIFSDYDYNVQIASGRNNLILKSAIRDLSLKQGLQYYINNNNKLDLGFEIIYHVIHPGIVDAAKSSSYNSTAIKANYSMESAAYFANDLSFGDNVKLNYGLRVSAFSVLGPGEFYSYDHNGNLTDSSNYGHSRIVKTYFNLEPRFSMNVKLSPQNTFKFSYVRNVQNLHLLSNSVSSNPTDLWIPSSPNVKPEIADQVSMGLYRDFQQNKYEISGEAYYKLLWNQIDYRDGAELAVNEQVESQLLYGKGKAYGLELFLKKKTGNLTGWVSYTLSRTLRKIDQINHNLWYPARQDQTHNFAIVAMYKLGDKWTLSSNWVYNTGNAVTFPSGKYEVNGQTAFYYTNRNDYRMPDYHRLDIAATVEGNKTKKWQSSWTFSLYNVYGRENAYSIKFVTDPNHPSKTKAVQTTLFRWVPSITYNFKF